MGKSQSEPQEKDLQKQTDAVLRLLTKRGILPNGKITDEKRRAALQKRQKESYHNTELLLKNYRIVAWMVECFPETVAAELEKPFETVDALLDGMEISSTFGERKLERRTAAVEETRLMSGIGLILLIILEIALGWNYFKLLLQPFKPACRQAVQPSLRSLSAQPPAVPGVRSLPRPGPCARRCSRCWSAFVWCWYLSS